MSTDSPFLSKSKYISGLQCHKLLWHYYNAKDQIPEVDAATQAIFDQGHIVGEYAKKLFPDGVEVGKDVKDFEQVLEPSSKAVALRIPLFEPAFKSNNAYMSSTRKCNALKELVKLEHGTTQMLQPDIARRA